MPNFKKRIKWARRVRQELRDAMCELLGIPARRRGSVPQGRLTRQFAAKAEGPEIGRLMVEAVISHFREIDLAIRHDENRRHPPKSPLVLSLDKQQFEAIASILESIAAERHGRRSA